MNHLISKYIPNLQNVTLISMYLTPGLNEFINIKIHSLPTTTDYNCYNVLLLISRPILSSSGLDAFSENVYCIDPH